MNQMTKQERKMYIKSLSYMQGYTELPNIHPKNIRRRYLQLLELIGTGIKVELKRPTSLELNKREKPEDKEEEDKQELKRLMLYMKIARSRKTDAQRKKSFDGDN